jgi:hypothetical protein
MKYLFLMMLLMAPAADEPTIPVVVLKTTNWVSDCQYGPDKCVGVEYKNVSKKDIVAVEFGIVFIDVTGDRHTYAHSFLTENHGILMYKPVAPGKKKTATWDNLLYSNCRKHEVKVLKVAFKDGTVWDAESVK